MDFSRQKQCEENLQFQAVVNVQIASQQVVKITRDRRFTNSDQLSSLGRRFELKLCRLDPQVGFRRYSKSLHWNERHQLL